MKKISLVALSLLTPVFVLAQGTPKADFDGLNDYFGTFITLINTTIVPLIFIMSFVVFIWGVFQYFIAGASDPAKLEQGKQLVKYSLIGFILMVSIWGIVNIVAGGLGLDEEFDTSLYPKAPSADSITD